MASLLRWRIQYLESRYLELGLATPLAHARALLGLRATAGCCNLRGRQRRCSPRIGQVITVPGRACANQERRREQLTGGKVRRTTSESEPRPYSCTVGHPPS